MGFTFSAGFIEPSISSFLLALWVGKILVCTLADDSLGLFHRQGDIFFAEVFDVHDLRDCIGGYCRGTRFRECHRKGVDSRIIQTHLMYTGG